MSITTPPALTVISLAECGQDFSQREDAHELVDGVPTHRGTQRNHRQRRCNLA